MVDGRISWALSQPLRLLLSFTYRFVPCKMQKLPRKQKALLPPPSPPQKCLQIPSPLCCVFLPEAAGIIDSFHCTVSRFQQEGGIVPF